MSPIEEGGMSGWRKWACLWKDRRGIAAVEFALTLPFLLLIYFGGVELTQGVTLNRQVALTTTTIATIVSQYTTISASTQLADILTASTQIMTPYGSGTPKVVVSLITIDNNANATVTWSQTLNGTAHTVGAPITVPANLDIANTTLILSETNYSYAPAFDFLGLGPFNLYASIYMVPRESTTINLTA
jgi:Flp pilus assembly protein TadG